MLRAVQRGDLTPLRRHDATIDKALEAICLKAMAHRPVDRYASPKVLAEDVERWMADESVSAWREPWTREMLRWLTRHRTGVTGAAAAILAGFVGLVAVLGVQSAANASLSAALLRETRAKNDLAAANDDLARSRAAVQARYDLAVDAIKTFHTGVSEDFLLKQDQFRELRDRLLKSAADFYGKLVALLGKETDFASRRALAASNLELAGLTAKVGRDVDALAAHRSVLAAREALAAEPGADAGAQADVGRSLTAVARLLESTGKTTEALAAHRRAESLLAGPAGSDPEARAALAECRARMGYLLGNTGDLDAARAAHDAALADRRTLSAARPDNIAATVDLAGSLDVFGHFKQMTGRTAEALASFQEGRAVMERAARPEPGVTSHRELLAHLMGHVGTLLWETGQPAGAEAEYRQALAIQQKLADDHPAVTEFRSRLADSHLSLGSLLSRTGQPAGAEAEQLRARVLYQKLADDHPTVPYYRNGLASALTNLGDVVRPLGRAAEARAGYDRAIALRQRLVEENPKTPIFRSHLAYSSRRRGLALGDLGERAGAAADARRALTLYDGLPSRSGEDWFETACCHAALLSLAGHDSARVSAAEGEEEATRAMGLLHKAVGLGYRDANAFRTESALDPLRARADFQLLMMDLAMPTEPFAAAR